MSIYTRNLFPILLLDCDSLDEKRIDLESLLWILDVIFRADHIFLRTFRCFKSRLEISAKQNCNDVHFHPTLKR